MITLQLLLCAGILSLAMGAFWRLGAGGGRALGLVLVSAALFGTGLALMAPPGAAERTPLLEVRARATGDYVTSDACRSCHPAEYDSWHTSYHRSMTEVASTATVRAPWTGELELDGRSYGLLRRGEEYWARLPDPDLAAALARQGKSLDGVASVERPIVMTTGSHHYQAYWLPGARGNELWQLPFVYHFESQRFIPRHAAFLQPEADPPHWARWNSNCIQCHSVLGEPRHELQTDAFDSRLVELGIACEACHGPGGEHVAKQQNPLQRHRTRQSSAGDPSIENPARLGAERGSEICGQCHSYFVPNDASQWWQSGFSDSYRPGDALERSRRVLHYEPHAATYDPALSTDLSSLFYSDGTIRVGGREWNGLSRSACFERGQGARQLRCTSCHQLHGGSRDDQLGPHAEGNASCESCHEGYGPRHTRHAPDSSGSQCVNCHMPFTTYALFKGIRSHRITRPVAELEPGGPPNACNACHQDKALAWTSQWLTEWRTAAEPARARRSSPPLPEPLANDPRQRWPAAAIGLLSGDAATRVIVAYQLGWAPAQAASGSGWQAQLLIEALADPYAAVRFVAHRSLRSLPAFESFEFDFLAPPLVRAERQRQARETATLLRSPSRQAPVLPLDSEGRLDRAFVDALSRLRDDRPIRIAE